MRKSALFTKATLFITLGSFGFFQAVILVPDTLAQATAQAPAPAPGQPPLPGGKTEQPVDIQANQQEFAEDQIIATGNVKVTYKESIVRGPQARLFRDANGQAQRAIFTGHPYLTQNDSKINSDTLIFEIANSKVIAQGHAHSEIISTGNDEAQGYSAGKSGPGVKNPQARPVAAPQVAQGGVPKINWPHDGDDANQKPPANEEPAPADSTAANGTGDGSTPPADGTAPATTGTSATSTGTAAKKPTDKDSPPEKIITDSDYQEYAKQDGKFDAFGHVHVIHEDISVRADKVSLVYGLDGKPETALFTGNVDAVQKTNHTYSDMMTYYLQTKRLQATGNVRSKVIQKKPPDDKDKKNGATDKDKKVVGAKPAGTAGGAQAAQTATGSQTANKNQDDDTILVVSDAQDYTRDSGRMMADGNVHVYYQDTVGIGPKAILLKNEETGKAEKVIFIGRSQISQTGKRWIADRITFTVANKKVLAEGNSRAFILPQKQNEKKDNASVNVASSPQGGASRTVSGEVASQGGGGNSAISASKVEATR
jgi:lipopolysaccharide export system protein LptA